MKRHPPYMRKTIDQDEYLEFVSLAKAAENGPIELI